MDRGVALVAPLDPPALANPDAPSHS
jgi:hypothetical protein